MTNGEGFKTREGNWLSKNRFRLLFFIGLLASQVLLLYLFGDLLYWHFFNQRPAFFISLVILFGLEIALASWFLRDIKRAARLWLRIPVIVVAVLVSGGIYLLGFIMDELSPMILIDSEYLGQRRFYLTAESYLYEKVFYFVNDCDILGRNCVRSKPVLAPLGLLWASQRISSDASLFISPSSNSISILESDVVIFEYPLPQSYP